MSFEDKIFIFITISIPFRLHVFYLSGRLRNESYEYMGGLFKRFLVKKYQNIMRSIQTIYTFRYECINKKEVHHII